MGLIVCALFAAGFATPARAQFIGYTFPQTVTQTLAPSGTACTGSAQTYSVTNLGQTVHFVSMKTTGSPTSFIAWIQGVDAYGNVAVISDTVTQALSAVNSETVATGVGYYPIVQVVVICTGGSGAYTLNYSGTSASVPTGQGAALSNTIAKAIVTGGSATNNYQQAFAPPYGNTTGFVTAEFSGAAGPSGSTLKVQCLGPLGYGTAQSWTLATTQNLVQTFPVAAQACPYVQISVDSGGTSTASITMIYTFSPPGFPQQFSYSYVNTNSVVLKTGPGFLHTVTIDNIAASGSFAAYDNTACSGTLISSISAAAAVTALPLTFDANFQTGLCISTSGTVSVSFN